MSSSVRESSAVEQMESELEAMIAEVESMQTSGLPSAWVDEKVNEFRNRLREYERLVNRYGEPADQADDLPWGEGE